ncbi:MAG TPA: hypothetical protein VHE99_06015 [Gammaproteobacteria bacterium]|nr:hypothetical protein [Gammaproteobacteria bacterium]
MPIRTSSTANRSKQNLRKLTDGLNGLAKSLYQDEAEKDLKPLKIIKKSAPKPPTPEVQPESNAQLPSYSKVIQELAANSPIKRPAAQKTANPNQKSATLSGEAVDFFKDEYASGLTEEQRIALAIALAKQEDNREYAEEFPELEDLEHRGAAFRLGG